MKKKSNSQYVQMELPLEGFLSSNCSEDVKIRKDGSHIQGFWTLKKCKEVARDCKNLRDFIIRYSGAYNYCKKHKCIRELGYRMPVQSKFWDSKAHCYQASKKCVSRMEFKTRYSAAYKSAIKKGWIDEFFPRKLKSNGYYTKDRIVELARACTNITEFQKKHPTAYNKCRSLGLLDNLFIRRCRPRGYWTKERCKIAAKKCGSISHFFDTYSSAYTVALKNGWLDEFFIRQRKPRGYWTKDRCKQVAMQCESIKDFEKRFSSAYSISRKNGWIDEFFHRKRHKLGYWTRQNCEKCARDCKSASEFEKKHPSAYNASRKEGWLSEFEWFNPPENLHKNGYFVYVYEFDDGYAYVGLSCQKNGRRDWSHRSGKEYSAVYNHHKETGNCIPQQKILQENLSANDARTKEGEFIRLYKDRGWKILNIAKPGSLGGAIHRIWTKRKTLEVAIRCKTISQFERGYPGAYGAASRNGWLNDIYSIVGLKKRHRPCHNIFYVWDAGYGNLIGRFTSKEVAHLFNIHTSCIYAASSGKSRFTNGYIITRTEAKPKKTYDFYKKVLQLDNNGKVVKIFYNVRETRKAGYETIRQAIMKGYKCKGFRFRYATKEDLDNLLEQETQKPHYSQDGIIDKNHSETTYIQPELPLAM